MQLNSVMDRIDGAFGEDMPFTREPLQEAERNTLSRVFGDLGYQHYLQDQISRQVIRDYLANAVLLGHLLEQELENYSPLLATCESRGELALQMIVASVDQVREVLHLNEPHKLSPLLNPSSPPSYIRLIQS